MMSCLKHLTNKYVLFGIAVLFAAGCSKKEKTVQNVVQVNDAVLTEEDLNQALSENSNHGKYREEYIQNWIETEILYQKAKESGIDKDKEYQSILERSRKRLAVSMYLEKLISQQNIEPTDNNLENYYNDEIEDFRLNDNTYVINLATFTNFDDAVHFRTILLGSDWEMAVNTFRGDQGFMDQFTNKVFNTYQLQPVKLFKLVSNLVKGEISPVLETEPARFTVVQLIEKLNKGDIPPYLVVKERVRERYMILKRKEYIHNYIDKLIADHNVEIKRYNE